MPGGRLGTGGPSELGVVDRGGDLRGPRPEQGHQQLREDCPSDTPGPPGERGRPRDAARLRARWPAGGRTRSALRRDLSRQRSRLTVVDLPGEGVRPESARGELARRLAESWLN